MIVLTPNPTVSPPVQRSWTPSLVGIGITQQKTLSDIRLDWFSTGACPDSAWIRGVCGHGTVRWYQVPCKRRDCLICGAKRRQRIAWRIAHGLEALGGDAGGAWIVGTFSHDISKKEAIKVVGKLIRWLRQDRGLYPDTKRRRIAVFKRRYGRSPNRTEKAEIGAMVKASLRRDIEYASTWELQGNGRLHVNIVLAPWKYIPQRKLQDAWKRFGGGILWVERVGCEIGVEAAKSRQRIANYMGKWDQMVRSGRGVTYSRGWPKLPVEPIGERRGDIYWTWIHACTEEAAFFWNDRESGNWMEVAPNEWGRAHGEKCNCFQRVDKPVYGQSRDPPAHLPDSHFDGCHEWLASINQVVANIIESRRESHEPELNDLDEAYRAYCERNEVPFDPAEIWRFGVAEAVDLL